MKRFDWRLSPALLLALAACQPAARDPNALERIDLAAKGAPPANGGLPDAAGAQWQLAADSKSLQFANPAGAVLLSLACDLRLDAPPQLRIVQHGAAQPGAKALFALVGNGMVARIDMDAQRDRGRWLWQGSEPADWPKLDVLTGTREVIATMPGGGEIKLAPSPLPQQLITWCRAQGRTTDQPAASPSPLPSPA